MSNRVEDLESQVAELQATIDGLTEELVETKERVRKLEETAAQYEEAVQATPGQGGQGRREGRSESKEQTTAEQQAEARGTDERRDAQFVENREHEESEPEPGSESEVETEVEAEADTEESDDDDGDDIIVA